MMRLQRKFRNLASIWRSLGRLTPVALVTALLPIAGSAMLIGFGYPLGEWMRENQGAGSVVFAVGVLVLCGFALLPTNVVGVLGGWAFSVGPGIVLLMIGVAGAAIISFYVHKRLAGERLEAVTARDRRAEAIHQPLTSEGFWKITTLVSLLRLSVVMPFAFTNFFLAAARVPVGAFLIGTLIGMLPRSSAMVFVGAGLSEFTLADVGDPWMFVAGIAATLAALVLIGVLSRRALDRLAPSDVSA